MKKKLNALETNILQCTVLMLIVGLLMTFALNKKTLGIVCLVISGIFLVSFIIILSKQGLDIIDKETGEKVTKTKDTGNKSEKNSQTNNKKTSDNKSENNK